MAYTVNWRHESEESQTFDDEAGAREAFVERSKDYGLVYGRCNSELLNGQGEVIDKRSDADEDKAYP
jgi:hypothetical protein